MAHGSVATGGSAEQGRSGTNPTREGAPSTGTGVDAPAAGAALVLSLYGAVVIIADLLFGEELVPHSGLAIAGIMIGCLIVGAVIGGAVAARSSD